MKLIVLASVAVALASPALAQTSYQTYGNQTYGSDGSHSSTYGNQTYYTPPVSHDIGAPPPHTTVCSTIGNQTFCN